MRNETEFIKCSKNRHLTAKAQKFLDRCIEIGLDQYGLVRYDSRTKPYKDKLSELIKTLFIDKGLSIDDIKELIKNRKITLKIEL